MQIAWQDPFMASELFLLKPDHIPGDYGFDPLGLAKGKDDAWLDDMKIRELNNGRVAMIAISGMVAQELVQRVNLLPADFVVASADPRRSKRWKSDARTRRTKRRARRRLRRRRKPASSPTCPRWRIRSPDETRRRDGWTTKTRRDERDGRHRETDGKIRERRDD